MFCTYTLMLLALCPSTHLQPVLQPAGSSQWEDLLIFGSFVRLDLWRKEVKLAIRHLLPGWDWGPWLLTEAMKPGFNH